MILVVEIHLTNSIGILFDIDIFFRLEHGDCLWAFSQTNQIVVMTGVVGKRGATRADRILVFLRRVSIVT